MIHAKRQIDDARRILGTNYRYASMKANSFTLVQEWAWDCGCVLKCSGKGRDGVDFAFYWDRCGAHAQSR